MAVSGVPGQPTPSDSSDSASQLADLERRVDEMRSAIVGDVTRLVNSSVKMATDWTVATAFAVPSGGIGVDSIATLTIPRPEGYPYAAVIATGYVAARNPNGSELVLQAIIEVDSVGSGWSEVYTPAGATLPVVATRADNAFGTGDLAIRLKVGSTSAWAAQGTNRAVLTALVTFHRSAP